VEQDDKGWDARKRAYCLKIQPATGSFARNLIYSTKPRFVTQRSLSGGERTQSTVCPLLNAPKKNPLLYSVTFSEICRRASRRVALIAAGSRGIYPRKRHNDGQFCIF
ncbi:hypothetical protein, partial [Enterobacter hormaechei]|uniref:hypothetical protein n=1 Tax=Enterobacter hormaechei TaxID=158836 RepID=UPI0035104690